MADSAFKNRVFALLLFAFQVGMLFAYGFGVNFFIESNDGAYSMVPYIFVGLMALLGWGMILSYSYGTMLMGLLTTLLVVVVSMQLQPLMSTFWWMVFNGFRLSTANTDYFKYFAGHKSINDHGGLSTLGLHRYNWKSGPLETLIITIFYNIGWPLALFAIQMVFTYYSPFTLGVLDDYGGNYIYVFAGSFGLMTALILNCRPATANNVGQALSKESGALALAGTGLIFATFPFTGILAPYTVPGPTTPSFINLRFFEGPMNIYFALSASVIVTYWSSAIFGGGKLGMREALLGTLSGGVIIASSAGWIYNIGACICVGAFAGLFSGFYLKVVAPRINKVNMIDNLGLLGPVLIVAFFGTFVVSPAAMGSYENNSVWAPPTFGAVIPNQFSSRFELGYFGITLAVGLGFGLFAGLFAWCGRTDRYDFHDRKWVESDFGLFNETDTTGRPVQHQPTYDTQQQLKNQYAL